MNKQLTFIMALFIAASMQANNETVYKVEKSVPELQKAEIKSGPPALPAHKKNAEEKLNKSMMQLQKMEEERSADFKEAIAESHKKFGKIRSFLCEPEFAVRSTDPLVERIRRTISCREVELVDKWHASKEYVKRMASNPSKTIQASIQHELKIQAAIWNCMRQAAALTTRDWDERDEREEMYDELLLRLSIAQQKK